MSQPRQIKDGPWCWQHKDKLTKIANIFDATNDVNSARTIYSALTEFASDSGSETFTVRIAQIAQRAGVSYRTAVAILKRFELLKLIEVTRQVVEGTKERAPSTYTMLGNQCITLCNSRNQASLQRRRKEKENNKREKEKKGEAETPDNSSLSLSHHTSNSFSSSTLRPKDQKEVEDFCLSIGLQPTDGEVMWLRWQSQGFGKTRDWKAKIRQWKIEGYHPSQKQQTSRPSKSKPKEPAPIYDKLPEQREPTAEEWAKAQLSVREAKEKLSREFYPTLDEAFVSPTPQP